MKKVLVLDFGSQFTQLITRRIRELNIYSEVQPYNYPVAKIKNDPEVQAIILSGGPGSVYEEDSPQLDPAILELEIPILGICYGMQILAKKEGGGVRASESREYGRAELEVWEDQDLLAQVSAEAVEEQVTESRKSSLEVWMSHGDQVQTLPPGYQRLAATQTCPIAAMGCPQKKRYALQFHPEVAHTQGGRRMLYNFVINIAQITPEWTTHNLVEAEVQKVRQQVGAYKVICGLSGGVDSAVTAAIVDRAVGQQLQCVFVDHGLLRAREREQVEKAFRENFNIKLTTVEAQELFLSRLAGVTDPEEKRKIIGRTFIEVFQAAVKEIEEGAGEVVCMQEEDLESEYQPREFSFLAQGTLYPDVIESTSFRGGPSHTIKSHHNVGGLPEKMNFSLVEPLRELFKDEVRAAGRELGLPANILERHPFPGPGLAIRIIGEVTEEKLRLLRQADKIFIQELGSYETEEGSLYKQVWQAFAVLTEVRSVGVMGDGRTYENLLGLRAVTASDGMTADWARLPYEFLARVSNRIINEVAGINRVSYDISSKPPATVEWE